MGWFTEEAGGLNRMYAGLYTSLQQLGVPIRGLIAGNAERTGPLPPGLERFAPREASMLMRWSACRRCCRRQLRKEPAVVAAHFAPYALPVLDLLRQPLVVHFHGPWAGESRVERQSPVAIMAKRLIERRVYRRADRFIVLSQAFGEILASSYRVPAARIDVVPGGVAVDLFAGAPTRAEARAALGLSSERLLIGVVRRLVRRVGLESLLDAMTLLRVAVPDAQLLVAGSGPLREELRARAATLGLTDHVRFLGFVPDEQLPLLYRASDVTVVPSISLEGFGLTTIESLAAGTPVLVTPVGGLPETVSPLDPGLVLTDSSPGALASGIADALLGRRRLPSADACIAYARKEFDWPVIARRTLEVYERSGC